MAARQDLQRERLRADRYKMEREVLCFSFAFRYSMGPSKESVLFRKRLEVSVTMSNLGKPQLSILEMDK
jgi:hypothetical protein